MVLIIVRFVRLMFFLFYVMIGGGFLDIDIIRRNEVLVLSVIVFFRLFVSLRFGIFGK